MTGAQFERRYASLRRLVDTRLATIVGRGGQEDLSAGTRYVLTAPGKRVRSTLLLLSCESAGGNIRDALPAAVAIEMMHNFTLVHDDVMDNAPSRRGRATVHTKWNVNNAILVGDIILGLAYNILLRSRTRGIRHATKVFTRGFIDVCEGQALDLEFEKRSNIVMREYFRMIGKKTGALIATATELGGLIGTKKQEHVRSLHEFGKHIGRAFQIQDDLLDVVADEQEFGKTIGADIVKGKKTFLLVHALARARGNDRSFLLTLTPTRRGPLNRGSRRELVRKAASIYQRCGTIDAARDHIKTETAAGIRALHSLPLSPARSMLEWIAGRLVQRTF